MIIRWCIKRKFSKFNDLKNAVYDFLNFEAGAVVRNAPQKKDRKYKNVQISQQFLKINEQRKKERRINIERRKQLLQKRLDLQSKLLTSSQVQNISQQIKSLKTILQEQHKEIDNLTKVIEDTEPQLMLVTGFKKLAILNKIEHLKYIARHPSGALFNPETIKIIQNIHYLVTNNLPVNRYKIYQIMPQAFTSQIGQLQESMRRLIEQKYLDVQTDPSDSIRFFGRKRNKLPPETISYERIIGERAQIFKNISQYSYELLMKHQDFLNKVNKGETPYRSFQHLYTVLLSKTLVFKLTVQQENIKKDLQEIVKIKEEYQAYKHLVNQALAKLQSLEPPIPIYVKNHPILLEHWKKMMVIYKNPVDITKSDILPQGQPESNILEEKIRELVIKQFDPQFLQAMNSEEGRLKIQKKNIQTLFYKKATQIYQNIQQQLQSKKQDFKILPKTERSQRIQQIKFIPITTDQLTKMIWLNNNSPTKYHLQFFSNYFDIEKSILTNLLKSVSFIKLDVPKDILQDNKSGIPKQIDNKRLKIQVIKFQL